MIVVTGGEGFIGKNLIQELQKRGYIGIVSLDTKSESLDSIYNWLLTHITEIEVIFHMGAITDTTEMNRNLFDEYNVNCSVFIWQMCTAHNIPLIYASSAATYGNGNYGFDDEMPILSLEPLNPYGWSKQEFDLYTTTNDLHPPYWYGLKFFNVYGYGESHKGKMASVVYQKYLEIKMNEEDANYCAKTDGSFGGYLYVNLFKSHRPEYKNGEQVRDFIYVDDVVDVCIYMYENKPISGIYNVGTGKAETFNDIVKALFKGLDTKQNILYIDIPPKIRDNYQYFTEAKISKLRCCGYSKPFYKLEDGIKHYIEKLEFEKK
jgi:ADP-L-glycero-D-manno-heptose 6-epimerase